jgi:hypothetical protein
MQRLILVPAGWPTTLRECPPGFFMYQSEVCFKSEYNAMEADGPVNVPGDQVRWKMTERVAAYCASGEYFSVGHPDERELLEVQPLDWAWEEY